MNSLIDRAIGFAARAHEGQHRKTGKIPYIAHPVGVAMILLQMNCDETVVAAGLLHDTVEDTQVKLADIRRIFGDSVADIVAGCTELPKKGNKWETRKLHMIESLQEAPLAVKLVVAADKYHNLSHMLANEQEEGPAVWARFGRGKAQQAWYYRSVLQSLLAGLLEVDRYPVFDQLAAVIAELFEDVRAEPPGWPEKKK